ncbi:hypothetical protein GCM10028808_40200 [Spirosoma migulaei]
MQDVIMSNTALFNAIASTEARPTSLPEIQENLDWLHNYVVELDKFLSLKLNNSSHKEYKSFFLNKDNLLYDRTFIGQTIFRADEFRRLDDHEVYCTSQPLTFFIDSKPAYEEFLANFKKDFDELDYSIILHVELIFLSQLNYQITSLIQTIWDLILEAEPIYIKGLTSDKAIKRIKEKLLEIEESKIKSPKTVYLRESYRDKEQKIYELLKNYFETSSTINEENTLVNVILKALKRVQGLSADIPQNEKARTKFTAEFIHNFIAKDESGYGFSETLKTMGEIDILIETNAGNAVAVCEGFNLKNNLSKNVVISHINKLFNYDTNGLKANFIIVYAETLDLTSFWNKYSSFVQTIATPYKLLEVKHLSDSWPGLPADIKLCKFTYSRNDFEIVVYHFFVKMR